MNYDTLCVIVFVVIKTNALKMRQNLGRVLRRLAKTGQPILVEQNRRPTAVLISLKDYQEHFADVESDKRREELVAMIKATRLKLPRGKTSLSLIREIRSS